MNNSIVAPSKPGCYLLHFEEKLGRAGHYTGSAEDIASRMIEHAQTICYPPEPTDEVQVWHKDGPGAKLIGVINYHFIEWALARVWTNREDFRQQERELKAYKAAVKLCPICSGDAAYGRKP